MRKAAIAALVIVGLPSLMAVSAAGIPSEDPAAQGTKTDPSKFLTQPLVTGIYTADPSAHVFGGRIYVYPSHDIEAGVKPDDLGSHVAMVDYHVFSIEKIGGGIIDHGVVLDIKDVPWAGRQLWAPDAAEKDGTYYLYFPAKDKMDIFRIGVAVGRRPEGPFTARPEPIEGSYSIDPAVFRRGPWGP